MTEQITVTVTSEELEWLQCASRRSACSLNSLVGLLVYRGVMDGITGRFRVGPDMDDLRAISLGQYA